MSNRQCGCVYYESIARTGNERPLLGAAHSRRYTGRPSVSGTDLSLSGGAIWITLYPHLPPAPDYLGFDVKLERLVIEFVDPPSVPLGGVASETAANHTFTALDALTDEGWLGLNRPSK